MFAIGKEVACQLAKPTYYYEAGKPFYFDMVVTEWYALDDSKNTFSSIDCSFDRLEDMVIMENPDAQDYELLFKVPKLENGQEVWKLSSLFKNGKKLNAIYFQIPNGLDSYPWGEVLHYYRVLVWEILPRK